MYCIAESMEQYRESGGMFGTPTGAPVGRFFVPFESNTLQMIAYDGKEDGWEHVSVSLKNRCPNWKEMCAVKAWFWEDEDCVMQLHPPKSEWINNHPHCLHLWRPRVEIIPQPPSIAVGIKT